MCEVPAIYEGYVTYHGLVFDFGKEGKLLRTPVIKRLSERDLDLLMDLYHYRLMTTDQLKQRYFSNSKSYVHQKLHAMRKTKLISTFTFKGSRKKEKKKGISCHRLTETGLSCLRKQGRAVEGYADKLKVTRLSIPYVLAANGLMVELTPSGWTFSDSRSTKKRFNLNFGDYIHGLLTDPSGKQYGIYVLEEGTLPQNTSKIISEIRDAKHPSLQNFIVFPKGADSYYSFMERALDPGQPLVVSGELKLVPYKLGAMLYKHFPTEKHWVEALCRELQLELLERYDDMDVSFTYLIKQEEESKYLVSLFDNDLMMIDRLKKYNRERFAEEGKRILVVTGNYSVHSELVGTHPFIDYVEISPEKFSEMCHNG